MARLMHNTANRHLKTRDVSGVTEIETGMKKWKAMKDEAGDCGTQSLYATVHVMVSQSVKSAANEGTLHWVTWELREYYWMREREWRCRQMRG